MTTTLLQQLNSEMAGVVERVRPSLVQISQGRRGIGSGIIWRSDGLIVTNAHVLQGRPGKLKVTLAGGETLPARLLARDKNCDLAALSIIPATVPAAVGKGTDLWPIELGDSRPLQPGAWVIALGHPWGVVGAATAGAVIDVGETVEGGLPGGEFVQIGLHLRPGHSGGPLVDVHGRLVGVSTMINGPDVGLAIPLHVVKAFLQRTLGLADETQLETETVEALVYI